MSQPQRAEDVRHLQQVHDDRYLAWRAACEQAEQALKWYMAAFDALLAAKLIRPLDNDGERE